MKKIMEWYYGISLKDRFKQCTYDAIMGRNMLTAELMLVIASVIAVFIDANSLKLITASTWILLLVTVAIALLNVTSLYYYRLQVIEAMLKKFTKSNVIKNYESIMNAVQGMFQTNMTTDEITALIQMQIDDMATWKVTSISADGTGDMLPTYSFGSQPLYVMHPKENAIVNIKKILKNIL